ncbi:uncharacterized protein ANIA_11460 [Aspergillus nidulans FGSC A4]|uniref:Uncharacterized protein n=1 Tax=Emericella nidulans (strain FGSC A4 / ATCC 38163 / CBS 112.46 / NRRL 194 / M139) TaxID=227321 RepID=C8V7Y7_EMENI|nr:hypothetical protein [Aspergillus nidulans FGSC A4]CBF76109.1 TPA: hypothetical protein ANIA_11460 [Aspergillus nidulans FGSC A4]
MWAIHKGQSPKPKKFVSSHVYDVITITHHPPPKSSPNLTPSLTV